MALVYKDRVKETSTTTGTGTLTLAGAVTGYRTFTSALANLDLVTYCIEDGTDWEVGEGTFTTSGTTLSRTTILASSNAGAAVSWSSGTRNVFLVVSARDVTAFNALVTAPPFGVLGTSGCIQATYARNSITPNVTLTAATSGTLRLWPIALTAGMSLSNISFFTGTTPTATGMTHQWFGLFDSSRNVLAKTADDTSTAWAASAKKTLAITGAPYVVPSTGFYYVGILLTHSGGTIPTIEGANMSVLTGSRTVAPIAGGNSTVSLTDPASCTGAQTAITLLAQNAYAEVS